MRYFKTEAISLRMFAQGDIHKRLALLTETEGIIYATAFGAYKEKSKLRGSSDILILSQVSLYHNPIKDTWKIEEFIHPEDFAPIKADLYKYYTASFWSELILKTEAGAEAQRLFHLLKTYLFLLQESGSEQLDAIRVQFLLRFLAITGFLFDLESCHNCGQPFELKAYYPNNREGLLCEKCVTSQLFTLNKGQLYYMQKILSNTEKNGLRIQVSNENLLLIKELLYDYILEITEQRLNTLDKGRAFL